jgi:hypothetical protein
LISQSRGLGDVYKRQIEIHNDQKETKLFSLINSTTFKFYQKQGINTQF